MNGKFILSAIVLISVLGLSACGSGPAVPTDTITPTEIPHTSSGWYDPFNGSLSGALPWTWKDENPAKWNLSENPGYLRIYAAPHPEGGRNILLLQAEPGDFTATTHLFFQPVKNLQSAGLTLFVENAIAVNFGRTYCDMPEVCVGNGIYFDYIEEGVMKNGNFATKVAPTNEAWLKLERVGDALTGSYSADGETWQVIGTHNLSPFFANPRIGLYALQDFDKSDADIPADFDFFNFVQAP